ncbi:MAG: DUF2914 domain-containing protein [Deltaproteobacteria bacterium]|nr:DUF2914 domain-containing protein [Deltaproteobacteria bacterium]
MLKKIFLLVLGMLLLSPQYILAQSGTIEIVEVVLARDVVDHEPEGVFEPPVFCEKSEDRQNMIPVVDSKNDTKICLWTKVISPVDETLLHTWYKDYAGWIKMAEVTLKVQKSPGFRTWSSKKIIPGVHNGKWMVVISAASDPEEALCKVHFEIK